MRDAAARGKHRGGEQVRRRASPLIAAALLLSATCTRSIPPADPQFVAEWMQNYYGLIRAERISPPVASRVFAYAAVGVYEGLATASPRLASLAGQLHGLDSLPRPDPDRRYDPVLVALAAERAVLDSLFAEGLPATRAALGALTDSLETARLALGIAKQVQADSRGFGERLGMAILAWAARDGFNETRTRPYRPPVGSQFWVNDSRADEYTTQNLTAVSDFVALDNPVATLRAGAASERVLALTRPKAAFIAIWHEKDRLSVIRPVTYIRRYIDSTWTPAIVTPPFPEYPSGHSGQSASAATVLTALLGPVRFEDSTDLAFGRCVGRMVLARLHTRAQPAR